MLLSHRLKKKKKSDTQKIKATIKWFAIEILQNNQIIYVEQMCIIIKNHQLNSRLIMDGSQF
jgi:hypothetical protein